MPTRQYRDIFGPGSHMESRFVSDYGRLRDIVQSLKAIDPAVKIVLVLGTYDLLHIGHARYIERCREYGDIVIVAVDTDKAVKLAKGPNRPVVPEEERVEMLTHLRHVDLVTLVHDFDERGLWTQGLIRDYFQPDVIVVSERPPVKEKDLATVIRKGYLDDLQQYCQEVVVLDSQAQTSTSAKIRLLMVDFALTIKQAIESLDIPGNLARAVDTIIDSTALTREASTLAKSKELKPAPVANEIKPEPKKPTAGKW